MIYSEKIMETHSHKEEFELLKHKIINIYEYILKTFCKNLVKFDGQIKKMERGIILPNGQEYFEDYFETTHKELKEKIKNKERPFLQVIKIFTYKDQEIIFSTDIKSDIPNKDIIYLDDALNDTPKTMKNLFYEKISELKNEDHLFRKRKEIENTKQWTEKELAENIE